MRELLTRIADGSSAEREEVLNRLRPPDSTGEGVDDPSADVGTATDSDETAAWPATPVQEQLWLINRLHGQGPAYSVPFQLEIDGPVDTAWLCEVTGRVLARHDGLTSRFRESDGALLQERVVDPAWLRPVPEPVTEEAAQEVLQETAGTSFDLSAGPLVRVRLLRLSPNCHRLLMVAHHAVTDGWSTGLLLREIARAYRGEELPEVAGAWARYASRLVTERDSPRMREAVAYWAAELRGVELERSGVLADHADSAVPTMRAGTVRFVCPHGGDTPQQAAAGLGVSEFVLCFAAFQHAVGQYAEVSSAVTGVPLLNRAKPGTEDLVGPLSNTLPIRVDLGDDVRGSVSATAGAVRNALAAQEAPVSAIVRSLPSVGRSGASNPLFRQLFNMGNLPGKDGSVRLDDTATLRPVGVPNGTARVGLELTLEETGEVTRGRLEFDRSLYEPSTGSALLEAFVRNLDRLCHRTA